MSRDEWYVVVDEDIPKAVAVYLEKEDVRADHVTNIEALGAGTPDREVLEYAKREDAIIVTANWHDFIRFDSSLHCGVIVEFGHTSSAMEIARGVLEAIDTYGTPARIRGWDRLDSWLG